MKIEFIGNQYFEGALPSEAGNFRKWIKLNHPTVEVIIPGSTKSYALHDYSLLLPLVSLAIEGTLENYLKLVLEYVEYQFRGKLKNENNEITFNVKYKDNKNEIEKEFYFKGNKDALKDTIHKLDINKFMSE